MDRPFLPPFRVGRTSVVARHWSRRAIQFAAVAQLRQPGWPAAALVAAVLTGRLVNAVEWGHGDARLLVTVCLGSLVATAVLAAGWAMEPDQLERGALRALAAALAATLPMLASVGWKRSE